MRRTLTLVYIRIKKQVQFPIGWYRHRVTLPFTNKEGKAATQTRFNPHFIRLLHIIYNIYFYTIEQQRVAKVTVIILSSASWWILDPVNEKCCDELNINCESKYHINSFNWQQTTWQRPRIHFHVPVSPLMKWMMWRIERRREWSIHTDNIMNIIPGHSSFLAKICDRKHFCCIIHFMEGPLWT